VSKSVNCRSGADVAAPGPTVSFGFNLGKIPDHGEDSDPILRDGPDLGLLAVFDGMGGAGGTVYDTDDGPRSGAYLASRIAREVVEQRMMQLLVPDWNLKGEAAAEDLRRSVQEALQERLTELKAPKSGLRSRLLRALPTTMAVIALQRTHRSGAQWLAHVFWAGDSRAYVFETDGARQLMTDDLRDPGDALANLRHDSVVSNALSADTEFHVNYRRVELEAPFLLVCATDGCFGYLPTPMHFEHLFLAPLTTTRTVTGWSDTIQQEISAVTGDDAAMAAMVVGADLDELRTLYAPRIAQLEEQFTTPIDELARSIQHAEDELALLRQRQLDQTQQLWLRYQPAYEQYLHPDTEQPIESEGTDLEAAAEQPAADRAHDSSTEPDRNAASGPDETTSEEIADAEIPIGESTEDEVTS
jgi:serine/threonine protein phosphatase PrpC